MYLYLRANLVIPRRATCYMQIMKPQQAVADFKKILGLEPHNETVRSQLVATQKLIRKIEFEKVSTALTPTKIILLT